jgi:hypothetical protein
MALLELEKLRRDINILFGYVRCLIARADENCPLVATEWSVNHTNVTGNPYTAGTYVFYNGKVYKCLFNNEGILPTNTTYWLDLGEGHLLAEEQSDWNATGGRRYILNKPTNTSDFINDGEDGTSPYVTQEELNNALEDIGSYGLYSQTQEGPLVIGTEERTIIGPGQGTLSVPANAFQIADSFHLRVSGKITNVNNSQLVIQLKSGANVIGTTGVISVPATTDKNWELTAEFTVILLGTAGNAKLQTNGKFVYNKNSSNAFEGIIFDYTESTTFDTTMLNTLDITATWLTSNPINSIHTHQLTLSKTF